MGWTNFIVVPRLKLVIETSRNLDELPEYFEQALDKAMEFETDLEPEVKHVNKLSLSDLSTLTEAFEIVSSISCQDYADIYFLYWLKKKGIDFEIISEYNIKLGKYKKKGFTVKELYEGNEE